MKLLAVLTLAMLGLPLGHPDPPMVDRESLTEFESCPLKVQPQATKSRYIYYENASSGSIVNTRLGCAAGQNSSLAVSKEFELNPIKPPLKPGISAVFVSEDVLPKAEACAEGKARLAVVFVEFSDGASWRAPAQGSSK